MSQQTITTMKKQSTELTPAELEVMQVIWEKGEVFLNEIYEGFSQSENPPAYATISTFVRILERKGYISHQSFGKSHRYFALISKDQYRSRYMQNVMSNFFNDSPSQLLSFFTDKGNLSAHQYEELITMAKQLIEK